MSQATQQQNNTKLDQYGVEIEDMTSTRDAIPSSATTIR